jgi:hypothetical protein
MKRNFIFMSVFILCSGLAVQPSNAVFGLSKCDKIIKSIDREQNIELVNWREFDSYRDKIISIGKIDFDRQVDLITSLLLVYESDIKISRILDSNLSCAKPEIIARNRQGVSNSSNSYNILKSDLATFRKYTLEQQNRFVIQQSNFKWWSNVYQSFMDWKTGNKIA